MIMRTMNKRNCMKGLTIVEVMIALGAGAVILTALTYITLTSLGNSRQGSSQALATQLAQEGMEIMRNMKENNWTGFTALQDTTYCLASTCTVPNSSSGGTCGPKVSTCGLNVSNKYVREVTVAHGVARCVPPVPVAGRIYIAVNSSVSWKDSLCTNPSDPYCHKVKVESCFANFDNRTAP